jgi:DNA-binding NarL/FixJ family response regulator
MARGLSADCSDVVQKGMNVIRVMMVEDHPLFRQGLRRVVEAEPDMNVICEVGDGSEALEQAKRLLPDVLITDVNLPGTNGLQLARELKAAKQDVAIIVLTAYDDEEQIFHALRAGASAYFPKDVNPARLMQAIRTVAQGSYVVGEQILSKSEMPGWLLRHFEHISPIDGVPDDAVGPLSPREMEILREIALGRSNKEIAYHLGISRQTVKNHMTSILRKLAVNDRTQAAMYAVRRGWIRLHDPAA